MIKKCFALFVLFVILMAGNFLGTFIFNTNNPFVFTYGILVFIFGAFVYELITDDE